jgi:pimeloyl-ACP methyl ester carboxylesterase
MNPTRTTVALLLFGLAAFSSVESAERPPSLYLEGKSDTGVILLHGHGGTADGNVVGPLMRMLNSEFRFHTLSLHVPQAPSSERGSRLAEAYAQLYPDVEKLINSGIDYLRTDKKLEKLYLVGFSMGTRMATAFLVRHPSSPFRGYISVSTTCRGPEPMDSNSNLVKINLPVLDIYGTGSDFDVTCAAERGVLAEMQDKYKVVRVEGAPHNFRGYESNLTDHAKGWLKQIEDDPK